MKFIDALAIVRDLADQNVLEECQALDYELIEERHRQRDAVDQVDALLDLLRGHHA